MHVRLPARRQSARRPIALVARAFYQGMHAAVTQLTVRARRGVGMLIQDKDLKRAKALVLHFIAQEDPAYGRSSIKQKASAAEMPADFALPTFSGVMPRV